MKNKKKEEEKKLCRVFQNFIIGGLLSLFLALYNRKQKNKNRKKA